MLSLGVAYFQGQISPDLPTNLLSPIAQYRRGAELCEINCKIKETGVKIVQISRATLPLKLLRNLEKLPPVFLRTFGWTNFR
jgi:hypothetical protein